MKKVLLIFILAIAVPAAAGGGQWILTNVENTVNQGNPGEMFTSDISSSIGEIRITKDHQGTEGYGPYVQKAVLTWSSMPTAMHPAEMIRLRLIVSDGGSTPGHINEGILSFSMVGQRDYDYIASKYRGMEKVIEYPVPEGKQGEELRLKIQGDMGTKDLPAAAYIYTYVYNADAVPLILVNNVSGTVTLNIGGVILPASSGSLLKPGDILTCGPDGKVLLSIPEAGHADLDKNTAVGIIDEDSMVHFTGRMHINSTLPTTLFLPAAEQTDEKMITWLKSSLDEISDMSGIPSVKSNDADFAVSRIDNEIIRLSVLRGNVEFVSSDKMVSLKGGETLTVLPNDGPLTVQAGSATEWWNEDADIKQSPGFIPEILILVMAIAVLLQRKR